MYKCIYTQEYILLCPVICITPKMPCFHVYYKRCIYFEANTKAVFNFHFYSGPTALQNFHREMDFYLTSWIFICIGRPFTFPWNLFIKHSKFLNPSAWRKNSELKYQDTWCEARQLETRPSFNKCSVSTMSQGGDFIEHFEIDKLKKRLGRDIRVST